MADIRNTNVLDDFDRVADEDPLAPPWYTVPGSADMWLDSIHSSIGGTEFPPTSSLSYYTGEWFYGPSVETWGTAAGSAALTDGWRYGMYTVAGLTAGWAEGYQCLPQASIGGATWTLRRYDYGEATQLAQVEYPHLEQGDIALMRRNGNNIECWVSEVPNTPTSWVKVVEAADTTYMYGPWYFIYGATGVETGWMDMGGGLKNRQHIYRWLPARAG